MHDQIIEQREKLVAHSDADFRSVEIVPKEASNIPNAKSVGVSISISNKKFQVNTFPVIERLCLDLGSRLNKEMFDTLERLYGKMKLHHTSFDLLM